MNTSVTNKITYRQAYDKIIEAYFKDEIKPYDSSFCFCGTLANNCDAWAKDSWNAVHHYMPHNDFGNYSGVEYANMERALLYNLIDYKGSAQYEDQFFAGMSAALDVLKEIHRSRGEDVDGEFTPFTKRELQKQIS